MSLAVRYPIVLLAIGIFVFATAVPRLRIAMRVDASPEIQVALPLFGQVVLSGGDRYLAANLGAIRALVTETAKMQSDQYKILAKVQLAVSWLNPAHEDNYYVAAAILPWYGQVDAAQTILRRASLARADDYQPAFFYAFNLMHFKHDAKGASEWLRRSASQLRDEDERITMENFAASWLDRADDLGLAIAVVDAMAKQAKRKDFRTYLEQRVGRLRDLRRLRNLADAYHERTGQRPGSIEDLVRSGFLDAIPVDPFGIGYVVDEAGIPNFGRMKLQ